MQLVGEPVPAIIASVARLLLRCTRCGRRGGEVTITTVIGAGWAAKVNRWSIGHFKLAAARCRPEANAHGREQSRTRYVVSPSDSDCGLTRVRGPEFFWARENQSYAVSEALRVPTPPRVTLLYFARSSPRLFGRILVDEPGRKRRGGGD